MNITIIGAGAWGATLAQVLTDNKNQVLVYDINETYLKRIKQGKHSIFDAPLTNVKAVSDLKEALLHSDLLILAVPLKVMRQVLQQISLLVKTPKAFVNVSKGLEPLTFLRVSQIVAQVIPAPLLKNFASLMGPSHAEEVILRKLTLLTVASENASFAVEIQKIFSNPHYFKVYTSSDLVGNEICSFFKNVLALINGILVAKEKGINSQAALMSRGILEMSRLVAFYQGNPQTVLGLPGLGDLIVTAFSSYSRNFNAGKKIGQGLTYQQIIAASSQTIEGFQTLQALYDLQLKNHLDLPLIEAAYQLIFKLKSFELVINELMQRPFKNDC
ncbi:NAD(P)H-dependent glycerol-3-phosphate dehydrogenase [Candidatus Phytoplasma solani]|uniref:Glycerol-3-phosphate dehydrogenase [NAD(P)+] n=1 Tax=Candidatus Phytoplasma solani TaxID=69896 RepID=A0A421NYW4_9MOLU|nr:NAD(P)H-dependent glycerol-3-phosphate dehydrogenase [Candidatus Phytoplasma solani]RMI89130.1 glycerol-3-phosphate dehydrogenase [Candidatus Phytoplasma solani]CCP88375.1 NAD(P)H-dependent glycerol-3-phosphate dehydrogenase [Candidatus Phytoplasma solani]